MITFLIRVLDFLQTRFPLGWFGVREARVFGFRDFGWRNLPETKVGTVWFHASSLGELEMLRPLVDDFLDRGEKVGVSVFSDSALSGLRELSARCVYAGFSPSERSWTEMFRHFHVRKLILAKYDLWPGMVRSCAILGIPVLVINARARKSFLLMRFLFVLQKLPEFYLFGSSSEEEETVAGIPIQKGVDPRWERVARRMDSFGHDATPRISHWKEQVARLPRPLGVIGSAWPEDLERVIPALNTGTCGIVVVPHSLSPSNLERIQEQVRQISESRVLIVSEMGILVELYGMADFAFVGGGFGKGIHSLIEPAAYGIPVASGPGGVSRFPECKELLGAGLYSILNSESDFVRWFHHPKRKPGESSILAEKRKRYRALLEECLRIR